MKKLLVKSIIFLIIPIISLSSCSEDSDDNPDLSATVRVNGTVLFDDGDDFDGDVDGDFEARGHTTSRTFLWQNSLSTADYNADITADAESAFTMEVRDADKNVVLSKSLIGSAEPDSFSGVTASGTPGIWAVTIILVDFNGDGSFSLSEGN